MLETKTRTESVLDIASLGEVMVRFEPQGTSIREARSFRVFEGGGEYNVAANLAKVFGMRASVVTALADNEIGRLVESMMRETGVDVSDVLWRPADSAGRGVRNGIYFMERGSGLRAAVGCSDRGNTAVSKLVSGEVDFAGLFEERPVRWFHTGGVFAGLSDSTPDVAREAMAAAKASGAVVSYDLNYRSSLWEDRGGMEAANEVNRELLKHADVVFGLIGFGSSLAGFDESAFRGAAERMLSEHPNVRVAATTLRDVSGADMHDFGGAVFFEGAVCRSKDFLGTPVVDRIGSGDAFAAGLVHGILEGMDAQSCVDIAAACGAATLGTEGDVSGALAPLVLDAAGVR